MFREKPHRLPREAYHGEAIVSITLCVERRAQLFSNPKTVALFVDMLAHAADRHSCRIAVYCFMPDHAHLVIVGQNPAADLWKAVVDFKQRSGYWLSKHSRGISWQKDFHDHVLRPGNDLSAHVRYVLDNPCRKGLATDWESYPFKGAIGYELQDVLVGLP